MYNGVQGVDAGGANYTLLGFVEHMGTMRSGHYVAYVQRGLDISDSPQLQSLLFKHGMTSASQRHDCSSAPPTPAAGRKKKGPAAKHASSSSLKQPQANPSIPCENSEENGVATKSGAAEEEHPSSAPKQSDDGGSQDMTKRSDLASAGAAERSNADSQQSSGDASTVERVNGAPQPVQGIPEDWESGDSPSPDKPDCSALPAEHTNGISQAPTPAAKQSCTPSQAASHFAGKYNAEMNGAGSQQSTSPVHARAGHDGRSIEPQEPATDCNSALNRKDRQPLKDDMRGVDKRVWYYVSDTQVKAVTEADVLSREAYILLYMRTA